MEEDDLMAAGFSFSTETRDVDRDFVHRYLSTESGWARGIPRDVVDTAIDHSVCASAFHHGRQVGFGRAISDCATFAYVDDVFVVAAHHGLGVATLLMETLMDHGALRHVKSWWLLAEHPDARRVFTRLGFTDPEPDRLARWMALPGRSRGFWTD